MNADGLLSEDELNSLIAHAHRRIEQLQNQIGEHQKSEQQRLLAALQQQKEEDEKLAAEQIEREHERSKADIGVVKRRWVSFVFLLVTELVILPRQSLVSEMKLSGRHCCCLPPFCVSCADFMIIALLVSFTLRGVISDVMLFTVMIAMASVVAKQPSWAPSSNVMCR